MKRFANVVLLILSAVFAVAGAQSGRNGLSLAHETQERGYWVDPSTGLMWAAKDNGNKELNWHKAMKYCRDLRSAGYSDWRLASIDELEGIYDKSAEAPGENPSSRWHETEPMSFHVKGGLFLRGTQWSSTPLLDDRGHPSGYAWRFDFNEGRRFGGDELWFHTNKHALCVRGPGENLPPAEAKRTQKWLAHYSSECFLSADLVPEPSPCRRPPVNPIL